MINLTPDKISMAIENLPEEVILAMEEVDFDAKVKEKCYQLNLSEQDSEELEYLANLQIAGLITDKEFEEEINKITLNNPIIKESVLKSLKEIILLMNNEAEKNNNLNKFLLNEIVFEEEEKDSRFNALPQNVQEAISLSGWQESLLEIAKENKLNIEQSGILEDITIKTMRNEISHNDFSSKISSAVGLDSDIASKIESSVAKKIFDEIRNIMRELEEETSDSPSGIPLPPYAKEEKIKNDENYFDEPPIPPYVNKNTLETRRETSENGEESLKINIKKVLSDKTMTSNMGGIQSQDFSIPKTQINSVSKDVNQETLDSSPKTNHDPYREII